MPEAPNVDIRPDHWEIVRRILQKHIPRYEVWAFGSRAQWTAKQYSDLDLAVITDSPLSLGVSASLSDDFSESDLPWRVDVVDWATTGESFREIIERDKMVMQKGHASGVASEWENLPFSEAVSINPEMCLTRGTTYPFVEMAAVHSELRCVSMSEEREFKGGGSRFRAGDTLLARITPCLENGKIARYCAPDHTVAHGSTEFIVIRGREGVSSTAYAYYLTKWEVVRGYAINQMTGTSGRQRVPTASLNHLEVPLPPLSEQHKIAHILGTLDDKIELNRQMNRTLEAMARAIFRAWFVDFEPVKAKAAGVTSFRGMPQEVFDQLPDRFTESELGLVPEGWNLKPLDEIADFLNGLALQKHPAFDGEDSLPVIKIAELRNGITAKSGRASREVPSKYIVNDGDFLFSWSGSLLAKFWTEGEGALNQHLFKVTSETYPMWFVSQWVQYHLEAFQTIAAYKATTMGHIQRRHLKEAMTVCAPNHLMQNMDGVMSPLIEKLVNVDIESRTLASIRNTLLPKLISGELHISAAEGGDDGD